MGMISDLAFTTDQLLGNVSFKFVEDPLAPVNKSCKIEFGFRGPKYIVSINISPDEFALLPSSLRGRGYIKVVPILLQQGINEWQSYANSVCVATVNVCFNACHHVILVCGRQVGNTGYRSKVINKPNAMKVQKFAKAARALIADLEGDILTKQECQVCQFVDAANSVFVRSANHDRDHGLGLTGRNSRIAVELHFGSGWRTGQRQKRRDSFVWATANSGLEGRPNDLLQIRQRSNRDVCHVGAKRLPCTPFSSRIATSRV